MNTSLVIRIIVLFLAWAVMLAGGPADPSVHAAPQDELSRLERGAAEALVGDREPFSQRAILVDRLQAASERAPSGDQRARFALLWLRSVRWLLASVFQGGVEQDPASRPWLAAHESLVVYSEPAGEWIVIPEAIWKIHDGHRLTASADEIAWFAVTNGYPGECEGYVPCYANILNWLDGEYLRRHPGGRHVQEAVEQVRSSLDESRKRLSTTPAPGLLDPATDCADLKAGLEPLGTAIRQSEGGSRSDAVAVVDKLLLYCP
jgi:hypothetical protein